MWQVIALSVAQSVLLCIGQVCLKFALARMTAFGWNWRFWGSVFLNWQFALSGILFGAASVLWMYILKRFPLSVAYPMISISYVFGMLAAIFFFHEEVSTAKWLGVLLIMAGCCCIAR